MILSQKPLRTPPPPPPNTKKERKKKDIKKDKNADIMTNKSVDKPGRQNSRMSRNERIFMMIMLKNE